MIPWHWMIPIMDTPKRIPITLSDTHYGHTQENTHYTEWYPDTEWYRNPKWFFLSLRVLTTHSRVTHDTENPGFLTNKTDIEWYPLHLGIPMTLSYTHYPEFQPIGYWTDLPMTLRDLGFLTNKPDTKWYPLHWRIPLTLRDTYYLEFF